MDKIIMSDKILQIDHVTKRFGGLTALDQVSMYVKKGEIVGLIGPNGAGKTTLFNAVAGAYFATSGIVYYEGRNITNVAANIRCQAGIGRTFQIAKPFASMTVLENVIVGAVFGSGVKISSWDKQGLERCISEAEQVLDFLKLAHKKDAQAGTLNVPERKRLELCRAIATKPKLLLLDEVIAGLNPSEVGAMVEIIRQINQAGISILMIEHVMKAVMGVSHRIAVLSFGKIIAEGTPMEIANNEIVIEAYLGKKRQYYAQT